MSDFHYGMILVTSGVAICGYPSTPYIDMSSIPRDFVRHLINMRAAIHGGFCWLHTSIYNWISKPIRYGFYITKFIERIFEYTKHNKVGIIHKMVKKQLVYG
jgi:hypothetical protein